MRMNNLNKKYLGQIIFIIFLSTSLSIGKAAADDQLVNNISKTIRERFNEDNFIHNSRYLSDYLSKFDSEDSVVSDIEKASDLGTSERKFNNFVYAPRIVGYISNDKILAYLSEQFEGGYFFPKHSILNYKSSFISAIYYDYGDMIKQLDTDTKNELTRIISLDLRNWLQEASYIGVAEVLDIAQESLDAYKKWYAIDSYQGSNLQDASFAICSFKTTNVSDYWKAVEILREIKNYGKTEGLPFGLLTKIEESERCSPSLIH